ncbi:MAG: hypothetical protein HY819_23445 [Acidobacteria bacterium]|nr:hypothetical protein [Acidobacteriota bacterium]
MSKIIILHESLPTRCDICHKVDLFNPKTGKCKRCIKVSKKLKRLSNQHISHPNDASVLQIFGALLIFGVNIYFLPYARTFLQNFWLVFGIYLSSLLLGTILILCGKSRSIV